MKTTNLLIPLFLCLLASLSLMAQVPSAEFTYPRTGLTANFNITYPDAAATYTWDFGDGNTATGQNPSHTYVTEGVYQAFLTATSVAGSETTSRWLSVTDNMTCLYADSLELVAFYNATGGANWTNTWDLNAPVSSWYGVTVTGCGVTCLDLDGDADCNYGGTGGGYNLAGNLIDLNLPNLISLFLSNNQLSGYIPAYNSIPNLRHLHLDNNELSGQIQDYTNLPNLTRLYLFRNQLSGPIPNFSNLPNLVYLDLSYNQINGQIPNFSNLPDLTQLYLNSNQLSGPIPDFSNIPNLTHFVLNNNQLSGEIPDFSNLPSMNWVHLQYNQLSGEIPNFTNLPSLIFLALHYNQLSGPIPSFSNNPSTSLYLNNNQLSGQIPAFMNQGDMFVYNNLFNFDGLSANLDSSSRLSFRYAPQDSIPSIVNGNTLSVRAGGDLTDNTYRWYRDGGLIATVIGDSTYMPTASGYYQCQVENSEFTRPRYFQELYLWSREVYYDATIQSFLASVNLDSNVSCNSDSDGSATVSASGGMQPYSYLWDNGETTATATMLTSGIHLVTVTESGGESLTAGIQISEPAPATSTESLTGGPPPFLTTCSGDYFTYYVYDLATGLVNYDRYVFLLDGTVIQDSSTNILTTNNLQDNSILSALGYDADGCAYAISNTITINAHPTPEITTCSPTINTLQITLTQGAPPWSFELASYKGAAFVGSENFTIYSSDTSLIKGLNLRYEVLDVNLVGVPCFYSNSYPIGHIEGCAAVCVGFDPSYSENYSADFPKNPSSIQWNIFPPYALSNGDVSIIGSTTEPTVEINFSNDRPLLQSITLQAIAIADCGIEVLAYEISLNSDCLWPGDVNKDGQVIDTTGIPWIDDDIALELAKEYEDAYNDTVLISGRNFFPSQRNPGCLATSTHDWLPQPSKDWLRQKADGTIIPALFPIKDSNDNVTATINLKYGDCNGSGEMETYRNWNPLNEPFDAVSAPTDRDIITYHADKGNKHQGNMPVAKLQNNFAESLRIVAPDTVTQGDQVVFTVYLGSETDIVEDVHHISFVGVGEFGDYYQPSIDVQSSHLSEGSTEKLADYPFLHPNYNGVENDSLRWYVSLGRPDDLSYSVDFAGEEVCQIECHIIVASLLDDVPGSTSSKANNKDLVPVTFQIPAAGLFLEGGRVIYLQSQIDTIWVRRNPVLKAHLLLEGAFDPTVGLMRDDLRQDGLIPATEPFSAMGYPFPHADMRGLQLTDSLAVLSVTGQDAVVDWVFIEVRDAADPTQLIAARPALLTRHGNVMDMDGKSAPRLWHVPIGEYYVVLRHRNHLSAMAASPVRLDAGLGLVDFVGQNSYTGNGLGTGQKELLPNIWGLLSGDMEHDNDISAYDKSLWSEQNGYFEAYLGGDFNLDGDINGFDKILWKGNNGLFSVVPGISE